MTAPRVPRGALTALPVATALAGAATLAVLGGWLATVSLQQDFAAYDTAARARALGLDPYLNHVATGGPWDGVAIYRHSRFLYPPLVAELFRPLAALPFLWAKTIFTALSALGLVLGLRLAWRDTGAVPPPGVLLLLAAGWPPVFVALERGQLDLLLLPLLAAAWRWRDRPLQAGLALGSCALGKPFVLGLLPLLVVARRTRWAAATVGALLLLALASVALGGVALNRKYLTEVLPRAARYGEGGPEAWLLAPPALARVAGALEEGVARIDGRTFVQQVGDFSRNASLPRALAEGGPPGLASTLALALAGGALLARAARRRPAAAGWFWGGLLLALVAAPVSWAMSLVWALPLVHGWRGSVRTAARPWLFALALTFAAGFLGPWLPGAWSAAGLAGVAAGTLWPEPEPEPA